MKGQYIYHIKINKVRINPKYNILITHTGHTTGVLNLTYMSVTNILSLSRNLSGRKILAAPLKKRPTGV